DGKHRDAVGPYPVTAILPDADLEAGLARLAADGLISIVLVVDDALRPSVDALGAFDFATPFKTHYLHDRALPFAYGKHHRYDLKRARSQVQAREIAPAGTSWSPGTTSPGGGRPSPSPLIRPLAFLLDKAVVPVRVRLDDQEFEVTIPGGDGASAAPPHAPEPADPPPWTDPPGSQVEVPLVRLAWARSGDKGDIANIGVIARRPEWLPLLWDRLDPQTVGAWLAHLVRGPVERHHLPGISAMNFVLHGALDGGGPVSRRMDPLGKGLAQILLDMPVRVPQALADSWV
ncbi:MAG: hypothetical protein ACKOD9_16600, partial [Rubrivivax sp.]